MERVLSLVGESVGVSSILNKGTSSHQSVSLLFSNIVLFLSLVLDLFLLIKLSFHITGVVESSPAVRIHSVDFSVTLFKNSLNSFLFVMELG
jgi:hypothetical protein